MPRKGLPQEIKDKVYEMYKKGFENKEIANLLGISLNSLSVIIRQGVAEGKIKPKRENIFGKTPTRTGQGKYVKKGYRPHRKLDQEQENNLLIDYFENNFTYKQIMEKYSVWQTTIKRIIDNAIKLGIYQRKGKGYKARKP